MPTHLIIGGDSTLGAAIAAALRERGERVEVTGRRDDAAWRVDLAEPAERWRLPGRVDVAYLCAAVTSLAACEAEAKATWTVNVTRTVELGRRLAEAGARVVFLSTNQVFDGTVERPTVTTSVGPASAYGKQKAAAEAGLAALPGGAAVVRITKVLGPAVPLFERWAAAWGRGETVEAFDDMSFAPVTVRHAVRAVAAAGGTPGGGGRAGADIVHVSASQDVTYHAAAVRLAARLGVDAGLVRAGSWRDAGLDPRHVPLHTAMAVETGGAPSPWEAVDAATPRGDGPA